MMMLSDDASVQEYERAEQELQQHANEPLSAELLVHVQPFTLERLARYMDLKGMKNRDAVINSILSDFLYQAGE
jgi:hypothetical protein